MTDRTGEIIDAQVFDLDKVETRRSLQSDIGRRLGLWRVTIRPARGMKSTPQLGYYFGVIVRFFADFIRGHDPSLSQSEASEMAHNELKRRFLSTPITDQHGRVIGDKIGSVAKCDKPMMSKLIDDSINFLCSEYELSIPEPSYVERHGVVNAASP